MTLHTDTFYQKKKKENGKLQRIGVFNLLLALCKARKKYLTETLVSLVTVFVGSRFLVQKKKVLQDNSMIE